MNAGLYRIDVVKTVAAAHLTISGSAWLVAGKTSSATLAGLAGRTLWRLLTPAVWIGMEVFGAEYCVGLVPLIATAVVSACIWGVVALGLVRGVQKAVNMWFNRDSGREDREDTEGESSQELPEPRVEAGRYVMPAILASVVIMLSVTLLCFSRYRKSRLSRRLPERNYIIRNIERRGPGHDDYLYLSEFGTEEDLEYLIYGLGTVPDGVCLKSHCLTALRRITWRNAGTEYSDWKAWWERKYHREFTWHPEMKWDRSQQKLIRYDGVGDNPANAADPQSSSNPLPEKVLRSSRVWAQASEEP